MNSTLTLMPPIKLPHFRKRKGLNFLYSTIPDMSTFEGFRNLFHDPVTFFCIYFYCHYNDSGPFFYIVSPSILPSLYWIHEIGQSISCYRKVDFFSSFLIFSFLGQNWGWLLQWSKKLVSIHQREGNIFDLFGCLWCRFLTLVSTFEVSTYTPSTLTIIQFFPGFRNEYEMMYFLVFVCPLLTTTQAFEGLFTSVTGYQKVLSFSKVLPWYLIQILPSMRILIHIFDSST